jgi:hypothetical protein
MIFVSVGLCAECNHGTTLYNGRCDRCRTPRPSDRQLAHPKASPTPRTVNDLMAALVAELAEGEVPQPLTQRFRLAYVWADLARLAGETLPPAVAAALDEPAHRPHPYHETHREPAFDAV